MRWGKRWLWPIKMRMAINKWKPQFGALIRFGAACTPTRIFKLDCRNYFNGEPENLMEYLTKRLAKSSSPAAMLKEVEFYVKCGSEFPKFLAPLLENNRQMLEYQFGNRRLFGSTFALERHKSRYDRRKLTLFIVNRVENKWFKVKFVPTFCGSSYLLKYGYKEIPRSLKKVNFLKDYHNLVKLYVQYDQSDDWDEKEIGHVACLPSPANNNNWCIVVRGKEDRNVLESEINLDRIYQKQEDYELVWSESDTIKWSLCFQSKSGCSELWQRICLIQGRDPQKIENDDPPKKSKLGKECSSSSNNEEAN